MATTKDSPAAPPEGVSPEQRQAFDAYIRELDQLKQPPPPAPAERPKPVSDDEFDAMTDRKRETYIANMVGWILEDIAKLDADRRRDADIEALKNAKPEEEKTPQEKMPTPLDKFRKWLWGDEPDKS
jgi:hypothetical protein